jgi:hypothetical protein
VEAEITNTLAKDDAIHRLNAAMRTRRYQQLMQLSRGWKTARPMSSLRRRRPDVDQQELARVLVWYRDGSYLDDSNTFLEEINPGNKLTGTIVFDVPKKTKPSKVLLKSGVFGFLVGVTVYV